VTITDFDNTQLTRLLVDHLFRYAAQLRFNLYPDDDTDVEAEEQLVEIAVDGQILRFELFLVVCDKHNATNVVLQASQASPVMMLVAFENLLERPEDRTFIREYGTKWAPAPRVVRFETEGAVTDEELRDNFWQLPDSEKLSLFGL